MTKHAPRIERKYVQTPQAVKHQTEKGHAAQAKSGACSVLAKVAILRRPEKSRALSQRRPTNTPFRNSGRRLTLNWASAF
jgi:hypothetical protein